jgi:hypothetical protein
MAMETEKVHSVIAGCLIGALAVTAVAALLWRTPDQTVPIVAVNEDGKLSSSTSTLLPAGSVVTQLAPGQCIAYNGGLLCSMPTVCGPQEPAAPCTVLPNEVWGRSIANP